MIEKKEIIMSLISQEYVNTGCWNATRYKAIKKTMALMVSACLFLLAPTGIANAIIPIPESKDVFGPMEAPVEHITKKYGDAKTGPVAFVNLVIDLLTGIAFVWLLIVIIYNGIKIITGSKSAEVLVASTRSILLSIAGIVLVAMAYYITGWVSLRMFGSSDYLTDPLKQVPAGTATTPPG